MYILSIDIGIKNLAYCLIYFNTQNKLNNIKILDWNVLDCTNEKEKICNGINEKKQKKCNYKAMYYKENTYYCKCHALKDKKYKIPNTLLLKLLKSSTTIKKNELVQLYIELFEINEKDNQTILKKLKNENKQTIINRIQPIIDKDYYTPLNKNNACNLSLITIGSSMYTLLEEKYTAWKINNTIPDRILIENQIGTKAVRMKTIQGMVTMFFIMKQNSNIEYISSINKLKFLQIHNGKFTKKVYYNDRKKKAVELTRKLIENYDFGEIHETPILNVFETHTKKDDLSDTLFQALSFIYETYNFKLYEYIV